MAEEVFFRDALYATVGPRHAGLISSGADVAATATTRNPALVFASAVLSGLFAAQGRASGGIQAPILTHLTWSSLMLRYLSPPFERRPDRGGGR